MNIYEPDAHATGRLVNQLFKRDGHKAAFLQTHHRPGSALNEIPGAAVPKIACVLQINRNRVRGPQFISEVLADDGRLMSKVRHTPRDLLGQHTPKIKFGQANVPMFISLDVSEGFQFGRINGQAHPLGDHSNTVPAAKTPPLDDGARQHIRHFLERDLVPVELLRNDGDRRPRRLSDAKREMPCLPSHRNNEVPAARRLGIDHQILHDAHTNTSRRFIAERIDVCRQVEIVVNRLRHMRHANARGGRCNTSHRERRVIAAYCQQHGHAERLQRLNHAAHRGGITRGIRSACAKHRAAAKVNAADPVHRQRDCSGGITPHEPLEPVLDAQNIYAPQPSANRRRGNDAVDPGSRAASDKNGQSLLTHVRQPSLHRDTLPAMQTMLALAILAADGFSPIFDGSTLDGWTNVNGAASTWRAEDGMIRCTGKPTCLLRTDRMYEDFILELEWKHHEAQGNAGVFVWSDALPAPGVPFSKSIEVQVMLGVETDNYTSEGDIFSIWGATMTPDRPHPNGWARCLPSEARTKGAGEWNHYRVECIDGRISLAVNGKVVSGGYDCNPRRGYICLEAEGSPVDFRNLQIKELPEEPSPWADTANNATGFRPLFNGLDFTGWKKPEGHEDNWTISGTAISHNGKGGDLWSEVSLSDFDLIVDWRWTGESQGPMERPVIGPDGSPALNEDGSPKTETIEERDSGIYLRGSSKSQVNIWCWPVGSGEVWGYRTDASMSPEVRAAVTPSANADKPVGKWNRYFIRMRGEHLTVVLNGVTVVDHAHLPGVAWRGPIALQSHGSGIEFANILVRQ